MTQMSKRWNKHPTFNIRNPLENNIHNKNFAGDIDEIYVSTFVISLKVWFLKKYGRYSRDYIR